MCLRPRHCVSILLLCAVAVLPMEAQSAPILVWNNGAPATRDATAMTNYVVAEDFIFPVETVVTHVQFWSSGDFGGPLYLGSITWMIFDEYSPAAASGPGDHLLASGSGDGDFFPIGPFSAAADTRYWLALHHGPLSEAGCVVEPRPFGWLAATPSPNGTVLGHENQFDCGIATEWNFSSFGWMEADIGAEHAFQLYGHPVPEPSTIVLLGMGVTTITLVRTRRRRARGAIYSSPGTMANPSLRR